MSNPKNRGRLVGEAVAVIGVIVSLTFVGLEIRQNTASVRAQMRQQLSDASRDFLLGLATSEVAHAWGRYMRGEELSVVEKDQVQLALVAFVRNLENVYLQHRERVIDESALTSYGWTGATMWTSERFTG